MKTKTVGIIQLIVGVLALVLVFIGLFFLSGGEAMRDIDVLYFLVAVLAIISAVPNLAEK
jgi:hypothetical protein